MDDIAKNVIPIRIEDEMRSSYLDYSMSVIIGRALPDVRDGLKPVHRRILYAMDREGLQASKKFSKCAGVVGEVLKKYHPHGDSAVYDALVRMAQPWNLRYPLVHGQGNFGSVDGDPAAAYRYTECRMTKLAEELLVDIDKETVGFVANFDGTTEEPEVLPAAFPNLLVNGADGIAVGMATKIPPHNLGEVIDACVAMIADPNIDFESLLELIPGPDFPTGGTIYGRTGIRNAYSTGRGRIVVRGNARFEDVNKRRAIVIDEIPYQVNKARLIQQIAELVKDKRLEGIHALRDESDRRGMRIVIELKNDAFEEVVLNHLYKHTALQSTFGAILLAIVNNRPQVLTLHELLQHYISHRREVVLRRTRHLLRKAKERAHILEGYRIALDHIDEVIALIRASPNAEAARTGLQDRFGLSELQAQAILDMRLQRLTGMEREKIEEEYRQILATIADLEEILSSEVRLMGVVSDELLEVRSRFADDRRTRIIDAQGELTMHDLVAEEDQIVTLSRLGYIKRVDPDEWRMQRRGGMGKKGMDTREEDFVTSIFVANTHAILLVFTTSGKAYPLNRLRGPRHQPHRPGSTDHQSGAGGPDRGDLGGGLGPGDQRRRSARSAVLLPAGADQAHAAVGLQEHPQGRADRLRRRRRRRAVRGQAPQPRRRGRRHLVDPGRPVHPVPQVGPQGGAGVRPDGPGKQGHQPAGRRLRGRHAPRPHRRRRRGRRRSGSGAGGGRGRH